MKKYTFTLFAFISPIALFAQHQRIDAFDGLGSILIILIICIIIFIVCRELLCWYYKINKMVSNQEEIIRLLKKIADKGDNIDIPNNKETIID